jgi:hypothetical protein
MMTAMGIIGLLGIPTMTQAQKVPDAWTRHIIDGSSKGADGVRLADVNGDRLLDITTGWEQGNAIRVYLNPGPKKAKELWPAVTVGQVKGAEDAVFADLDGDGAVDVISSCEGGTQCVFVHWAPKDKARYLDEDAWETQPIPVTNKMTRWMFALPMQVDGKGGIDLVVGSKNPNGRIGWLKSPENPRDLSAWTYHPMQEAGWIMSLQQIDMNSDRLPDVLVTDRKGPGKGLYWLKHPGADGLNKPWQRVSLGGEAAEVMFMDHVISKRGGAEKIAVATRNNHVMFLQRRDTGIVNEAHPTFDTLKIDNPLGIESGKAVSFTDIDLDGDLDIAHTTNTGVKKGDKGKAGVAWLERTDAGWRAHPISGSEGVKFDRIEMIDLDGDGDLDLMTCEENNNLGVIWYENPLPRPRK